MTELNNSTSQLPRIFYCRHMEPGNAKHPDGIYLTDRDCMKAMLPSFVGKPVFVYHADKVDVENIKEQADGWVTDAFYNELDGWAWAKFLAVDDKAHDAIKKGWSVSNAYKPTQMGAGGTKNNVPYKAEVLNGHFTHLAIVPDPRYEGALIMTPDEFKNYQDEQRKKHTELRNSKQEKKPMFKIFKNEKKEVTSVDLDTEVEISEGKSISVREMINAVTEAEKRKEADKEQVVEVNGKKIKLSELVNSFTALENSKKTKKNADDEGEEGKKDKEEEASDAKKDDKEKKNKKSMKKNSEKKCADDEDEEEMENSDEDEATKEEKSEDKEKKNSKTTVIEVEKSDKFFNEMRNAHNKRIAEPAAMVSSSIDQIERGKQRYGSDPIKKKA